MCNVHGTWVEENLKWKILFCAHTSTFYTYWPNWIHKRKGSRITETKTKKRSKKKERKKCKKSTGEVEKSWCDVIIVDQIAYVIQIICIA